MFSETDFYTNIIVQKLKLKCDATKVEINDMRCASCLPVAPTVMEATLGGSGGISPDPNLETKRDEEKTLEERRQRFWWIRKTWTQIERDWEEKEVARILLQTIRS